MRGVQFGVLTLFWLIGMGIILSSLSIVPALKSGQKYDSLIKTDVYMMSSAMDAAATYLNTSLQFSGYQSCYELLDKGGNGQLTDSNKISYGGKDYGIVPGRGTFTDSLSSSIQSYLNSYASSNYVFAKSPINKYEVNLPAYKLSLSESGPALTAAAQADGKMFSQMDISGGNYAGPSNIGGKVTIYKEADISSVLHLNCLSVYDKMKAASDELKAATDKLLQDEIKNLINGVVKNTGIECNNVLGEEETTAKTAVAGLSNIDRKVELLELSLKMKLATPIVPEADGPNKGKSICRFTKEGTSIIAVKVTIVSAEKYPVNNGKEIAYEPITSVFAVKSEIT